MFRCRRVHLSVWVSAGVMRRCWVRRVDTEKGNIELLAVVGQAGPVWETAEGGNAGEDGIGLVGTVSCSQGHLRM